MRKRSSIRSHVPRKRAHKIGVSPGSLLTSGEEVAKGVTIERIRYDCDRYERGIVPVEEVVPGVSVSWYNVDGVSDTQILTSIGRQFSLHPLTVEDILNTDQRPKMEEYEKYLFIVMKMLRLGEGGSLLAEQISIILAEESVLSFQEGIKGDVFDPIRARIESGKGRIRSVGPDYLCYALIDAVVDSYFVILESIGGRIEQLEDTLLHHPLPNTLQDIHDIRRELIFLRRSIWPLREVIGGLQRTESSLMKKETSVFLRDVYDHTIQVIDTVETYRDMVSGLVDLYMSMMSNRMNEVMKVLTIIATIFIPLTFIAGVYGMNFAYMPELTWPWGYAFAWGVMLAAALALLYYFRKKKWI